ncbi:hypothetical protein BS50DRAFT_493906 [Corynespora cassiicola Philippines]|uniref:Uncharacterized protein n=1 Tax=Corynespora cassiicola Philippines TaxID=1448308 RepID=A0A2T2NMG9_CORCC|nr:hypothetical protein BS50DRAFT_493906 [Corynespora cassiicola Philippines]
MATEKPPNPNEKEPLPDQDRLKEAAVTAQKALDAQNTAQSLRDAAKSITDPKRREKLLRDAYDKEVEAHGNSKKARMLQSGAFQGATGGAGIGGVVGMGVGTVVGTLVGGLTAIPTTGLGALVGSGVGAIHGPWIKLAPIGGGSDEGGKDGKDAKDGNKDECDTGEKGDQEVDEHEGVVPNPEALRQAADAVAEERQKQQDGQQENRQRKKPRKIEIRSGKGKPPGTATAA